MIFMKGKRIEKNILIHTGKIETV